MAYPSDPATRFALRVRAGKETVSRLQRLATERHLQDLDHADAKGLEWRPAAAREVCDFFRTIICLPDGRPFQPDGWEDFAAGVLCGWFTPEDHLRFRVGYVELGKGSGKTFWGAALLLFKLIKAMRGRQLYFAAVTQAQASLAFADAVAMVQASPHLREAIDVLVANLSVRATGAFLRPISSERRGLDGKRVSAALVDELMEHPDETVSAKLRAGTKGDPDALILEITNAGSNLETVCWKHHQHSIEVLTGAVVNESWFAYIGHLDACDACHGAGAWQPQDDCADCDDWQVEGDHWKKANPGLGSALPWQYLREQVREAQHIPSQRNLVRRLNFCQWSQQAAAVLIPPLRWQACGDPAVSWEAFTGRDVVLGIDLSAKIDLSSVVGTTVRTGAGDALNMAIDVATAFWMPSDTIQQRAAEDRVPYPDWAKARTRDAPYLHASAGQMVDHDAILAFVLDLSKRCRIRAIGIDQANATAFVTRLQRELGPDVVFEIPQGFRHLSEPTKHLEALVLSDRLRHDANPVMAYCMGNLAIEENNWQEVRPVKVNQRTRIDGGVALILALAMLLRLAPEVQQEPTLMIVGGRPPLWKRIV